MLRVGINGLGRIGRAILRRNMEVQAFEIVAVNDINPDISNIAYTLNFDTIYGRLQDGFKVEADVMYNSHSKIKVSHESSIANVPWKDLGVDVVIDASGVQANVLAARETLKKNNLQTLFVTHSPKSGVDYTMVLGANEQGYNPKAHEVVASSICDATALAPVMKGIHDAFGLQSGAVTTLHPWLNYQNLMDGPASSWSVPGEIYHHYALGRSAIGNMIPKPTTAIEATCRVVSALQEENIASFSYRTPTAIVGSADLTLVLKKSTKKEDVVALFQEMEASQSWNIIHNNCEPLVSLDFVRSAHSAIVDHRWTDVVGGNLLKMVLWYDNEWGYALRVVEQVVFVQKQRAEAK